MKVFFVMSLLDYVPIGRVVDKNNKKAFRKTRKAMIRTRKGF